MGFLRHVECFTSCVQTNCEASLARVTACWNGEGPRRLLAVGQMSTCAWQSEALHNSVTACGWKPEWGFGTKAVVMGCSVRLFHSTWDPPRPETEPISPAFAGRFLTPSGSDSKESACNTGDPALLPASGRSPGGGHGHPLQNSCLENPVDRGAWRGTVHRVAKSWAQMSRNSCEAKTLNHSL